MMRLAAIAVLVAALGQAAPAQLPFEARRPERVTIAARVERSRPGTATLVIEATPKRGIHVYAPGNPSYIPVSVHVDSADGLRTGTPAFPAGKPYVFGTLQEIVQVYSEPFTIRQPLTLTGRAARSSLVVTGHVRYQACDDRVCFPPVDAPFSAPIPSPAASSAGAEAPALHRSKPRQ